MNWLYKLCNLIYERKQIRIKFEASSRISLEYRLWNFSAFETVALGIGIAMNHFENISMVCNVDALEATLKQIDRVNQTIFCVGLLQLRQFSARIGYFLGVFILVNVKVTRPL